jgi:hypothetical protein
MVEIHNLEELISQYNGNVTVACDTEFKGPHTLTIQFAARLGDDIVVQVYSSPAIPDQPDAEELKPLLPQGIETAGRRVIIRDGRGISADLSPARVLGHLFGIRGVEPVERTWLAEDKELALDNKLNEPDGSLTVTPVAHFWRADFFRIFGRNFWSSLWKNQLGGGRLIVQDHKLLSLKEARGLRCTDPVLEYVYECEDPEDAYARVGRYAIKVNHFDTRQAFGGKATLDDLAGTFVGVRKLEGVGEDEKADMLQTFCREPAKAYAYAITDSVLTLLVKERMADTHAKMYEELGFGKEDVPPLRSTQGGRVADIIVRSIARAAQWSRVLSRSDKRSSGDTAREVSLAKVKTLLKGGSGDFIAEERLSRFGKQAGQTHGGLSFSRSPTEFFHPAPGMFRHVDLSGCYAEVMGSMSLYAGRPVIHEPGSGGMTLKDAVEFLHEHAAARDAWIIKVSGKITAYPNVLIPSTRDALTNSNFKSRAAKRRAATQWTRVGRYGFAFDSPDEIRKDEGTTRIYTDVIEAGVVAHASWLMIRALPSAWRREYESLEVDSILFYPAQMVANDGPAFDALFQQHSHDGTPWQATIDMENLRQLIEERIDESHVALRFQLGALARTFQAAREKAKREQGEKSAAERGWKEAVNSLYGVVASRHLATNNIVAANWITATARALAFAMQLSLNGLQVITDGCNYRKDQVPAGTFAECLAACPEYAINRAGFRGPFQDPASIPTEEGAFTAWYAQHVRRFFAVDGPEYDWLFGLHELTHKKCGNPAREAFDALCCDGPANYVKLLQDGDDWKVAGDLKDSFKARSFPPKAKEGLVDWLVRTFSTDSYAGPPPVTESPNLLAYKEAGQVARKALKVLEVQTLIAWSDPRHDPVVVYFPLGLERRRVITYKVLKSSAFLFRTPRQGAAFARAMEKFTAATNCGLELLALRRSSSGCREGSIADRAGAIYRLIRSGEMNLTKALNLTRRCKELQMVHQHYPQAVQARKDTVMADLIMTIYQGPMDEPATLTGVYVRLDDICRILPA